AAVGAFPDEGHLDERCRIRRPGAHRGALPNAISGHTQINSAGTNPNVHDHVGDRLAMGGPRVTTDVDISRRFRVRRLSVTTDAALSGLADVLLDHRGQVLSVRGAKAQILGARLR